MPPVVLNLLARQGTGRTNGQIKRGLYASPLGSIKMYINSVKLYIKVGKEAQYLPHMKRTCREPAIRGSFRGH